MEQSESESKGQSEMKDMKDELSDEEDLGRSNEDIDLAKVDVSSKTTSSKAN